MVLEKRQLGPAKSHSHVPATSGKLHTVIIHNQDIFCRGLRSILNGIPGFGGVAEYNWSPDLISQLEAQFESPTALVIFDYFLPLEEYLESVQRLSHLSKVVVLSAHLDDTLLVEAVLAGARGFLTKDIPEREILEALPGIKQGAFAIHPSLTTRLITLLVQRCRAFMSSSLASPAGLPSLFPPSPIAGTRSAGHDAPALADSPHLSQSLSVEESGLREGQAELTPQEHRVFQWLYQGLTNKQIAIQLDISPYTVGKHVQHILQKLGVSNRTQAAAAYAALYDLPARREASIEVC